MIDRTALAKGPRPKLGYRSLPALGRAFAGDRGGATAVFVGITIVALIGVGMLSIDVGQMVVLRNEMQNAADSACLAAAAQINGTAGAQQRAIDVAQTMALDESGLASGSPVLTVDGVTFYRTWDDPDLGTVAATADFDTNFVRIDLEAKDVDFLLAPAFNALIGNSGGDSATLDTYAVCQYASVDCTVVPLMICNDPNDPDSVLNPANFGRQTVAKEGPGSGIPTAPGNFGLLCANNGGSLDCGAKSIGQALASDTGNLCSADGLTTAPGSKTNQVAWGINVRFGGTKYAGSAAANIADYPRDDDYLPGGPGVTPILGDDLDALSWDVKTYWNTEHQMMEPGNKPVYEWDAVGASCDTTKPVGQPHFVYTTGDQFDLGTFTADSGVIELCTATGGLTGGTIDIDNAAYGIPAPGTPTTPPFIRAKTITDAVSTFDLAPIIGDTSSMSYVKGDYLEVSGGPANGQNLLTRYKLYLFETYYGADANGCNGQFLPSSYTTSPCPGLLELERRVVRVVVVDCGYYGVAGKTSLDFELNYIDVFLTEQADAPPDATIYAEVLREPEGSSVYDWGQNEEEILNVRLVE